MHLAIARIEVLALCQGAEHALDERPGIAPLRLRCAQRGTVRKTFGEPGVHLLQVERAARAAGHSLPHPVEQERLRQEREPDEFCERFQILALAHRQASSGFGTPAAICHSYGGPTEQQQAAAAANA